MLPIEKRILSRSQYKEWLAYDLKKYPKTKLWWVLELFNVTESAILRKHIKLLRKAEFQINTGKKIGATLTLFRLHILQNKFCLHIPLNCFEKDLKIMHVGPVLVNPKSCIGQDCSLHIDTAIAAGGLTSNSPVLGNGVVVGVGSKIIGGVHIANYVAIGANAVVTKDIIEENVAVAGVPAKIISNNGALEWNKDKI